MGRTVDKLHVPIGVTTLTQTLWQASCRGWARRWRRESRVLSGSICRPPTPESSTLSHQDDLRGPHACLPNPELVPVCHHSILAGLNKSSVWGGV